MHWIGAALLLVFTTIWLRTNNWRRALSATLAVAAIGVVVILGLAVYGIMRH